MGGRPAQRGLSEVAADTIRRAHAVHPLAAVQSEFSLFSRDVLHDDEQATTDELGIGFVAFSPLGRGTLTDDIRSVDDLDPNDARRNLPRFQPEALAANRRLVERVEAIARDLDATTAQVSLAWLIAPGVVPIPGTRRRERLDENAAAADLVLSDRDMARLTDAPPAEEITGSRAAQDITIGDR